MTRFCRFKWRFAAKALVSTLLGGIFVTLALAAPPLQSGEWSDPAPLAENGGLPVVAGDMSGKLHLFYVEGFWNKQVDPSLQAIMYMNGDGQDWSQPVDILLSPIGSVIYLDAVEIDSEGNIHLLWSDDETLYHSVAHVDEAANPRQWQTNIILKGPLPIADMIQDPSGKLRVLVRRDSFTVSYTSSSDRGQTWTEPSVITSVDDPQRYAIGGVQLAVAPNGTIHATWFQTAAEVSWNFWSVWYGRSKDGGQTWDIVREMAAPRFGASDIAIDGQGNVHLVWGRNIGNADGRWHQWSSDGGNSWSWPEPLFRVIDYASGDTGGYGFALDSSETLHLVNSFGNPQGDATAYHLYWQKGCWSDPIQVMGQHAHYARIVITQGNQLHFFTFSGSTYGIWYSHSIVNTPLVYPEPVPSARLVELATATPPAKPTPEHVSIASPQAQSVDIPPGEASLNLMILLNIALVTVFLFAALMVVRVSRERHGG